MQIKSRANKLDFATAAQTQTMALELGLGWGLVWVPGGSGGTWTWPPTLQIRDVMMSRWDLDFSRIAPHRHRPRSHLDRKIAYKSVVW